MKIIKIILSISLMSICSSCFVLIKKNFYKKDQTQLFTSTYTPDIEDKFNINGYYYSEPPIWSLFILFKDGTYLTFSIKKGCEDKIGESVSDFSSLIDFWGKGDFTYGGGIYSVVGDTIIVDGYHDFKNIWWDLDQYKLKILDKNTLEEVSLISFSRFAENTYFTRNIRYHFVPASGLPSPFEVKSKSKKWMWENKADWKAYKKQLDEYLEQKKAKNRALRESETAGIGD